MAFDIECPNANWIFSIAAFNDLNLRSDSGEVSVDILEICRK